ncbi:peptidoglycan/LPS O-acetylase OafA/YrhL [Actinoalloteichus hoggarensis]|uniref:Glucans biosynthesis protein n=1 Tax=Actinoalloteichus hoggarensis TaxID=1470176 RepID=A0A221VW59_9PSEU|nr:acyltransferase [Actinoalloteichus hoggarensis]ASO17738.1 glucans biosynthesis protein [Actinoalloteichus hoggarensis]MBB5922864.1 peptidoglycan/LPS O-acetylase OafA/YrhL [Actinoalloteichus hoggarensis]
MTARPGQAHDEDGRARARQVRLEDAVTESIPRIVDARAPGKRQTSRMRQARAPGTPGRGRAADDGVRARVHSADDDAITEVIPAFTGPERTSEARRDDDVSAAAHRTAPETVRQKARRRDYHAGLDLLRVLMAVAVVYTHLAIWLGSNEILWPGHTIVHRGLTTPLNLNLNLSFVGVGSFLLISGIVITRVADRESPTRFLARRLVRILPAMWLVTIAMYFLVQAELVSPEGDPAGGPADLLANMMLTTYFQQPSVVLLGVTWTLVVQLLFYTYIACTIPLLRRWAWLPPLLGAALVSVAQSWAAAHEGIIAFRIGMFTSYLPVLFIGQLIALAYSRRIPPLGALGLGLAHFGLFLSADLLRDYITTGVAHTRTLLLLVLLIVLVMNSTGRLATAPVISAMSRRSYSVYLVHTACIYPIMGLMTPRFGPGLAILVSLVAVAAATEMLHRCVEMPPVRLHRRWERHRDRRRSAQLDGRSRKQDTGVRRSGSGPARS